MNYVRRYSISGLLLTIGGYSAYQVKLGMDVHKKRQAYYDLDNEFENTPPGKKREEYRQQLEKYERELLEVLE